MKIVGLQKLSLIDYPDHLAATVFMAGCNLRCGYCHNRWMIEPSHARELLSRQELLDWLASRQGLLEGVCLSGGEPTLSRELPELLQAIKELGYLIKLDTNGTLPERLGELLERELVDYVAMDIKAPLDERYAEVAGRAVEPVTIRRSMELLKRWGGSYELRTTVAPGLTAEDLVAIAAAIEPGEAWFLQPFVAAPQVDRDVARRPYLQQTDLQAAAQRLQGRVPRVRVRG